MKKNNLYYKRHFIFKYDSDAKDIKRHFIGLDLFNNTWGAAEWLTSDINYNDLQTINKETVEEITKHYESKEKKKASTQSDKTESTTDPTTTETEQELKNSLEISNSSLEESEAKPETINKILDCLKCLSSDRFNYNDWARIGMIIKNETNDINLWKDWSKTYDTYNEKEISDKWETFKSGGNLLKKWYFN